MSSSTGFEILRTAFIRRDSPGGSSLALDAAHYARLGVPVFPCVPGGKKPLTGNGFHDATTAAARVRRWWERTPQANIGIPTGAASGLLVVDVDVHGGRSGFRAFDRARSAGLADGMGWLVRTPSGGLHAYYPADPRREQRSWQSPSAHIDFRGDGGYIIAPPSRREIGGEMVAYQLTFSSPLPAQPIDAAWLRKFLDPPRGLPTSSPHSISTSDPAGLAAWVAAQPEGGRNAALFWAACRMVESGHRYETTLAILGNAALESGLPPREIEATVRSAHRTTSTITPMRCQRRTHRVEEISL